MSFILTVKPSSFASCTQCCSQIDDQSTLASLESCNEGCGDSSDAFPTPGSSNCSPTADNQQDCGVGENFRNFGHSIINSTVTALCEEGTVVLEETADLEASEAAFSLAETDCQSCCATGQTFDTSYASAWSEDTCVDVCVDPASYEDCETLDITDRLGCAHGYDLRLSGADSVSWSFGTASVSCINGQIQVRAPDDSGLSQEVFIGIGLGAAVLVVLFVLLSSRKPKPTFQDLPLTRIDDNYQPSNQPNVLSVPGSTDAEHYGKLRNQLTLGSNGEKKKKPSGSTSFVEKPDLVTMKRIGVGTVSARFKSAVRGVLKPRVKKRKPYSVAEAKKNGMKTKSFLDVSHGLQSFEGGSSVVEEDELLPSLRTNKKEHEDL